MKILCIVEHFEPPIGGAELSLKSLLEKLVNQHEIHVLYVGDTQTDVLKNGMWHHKRKWKSKDMFKPFYMWWVFFWSKKWEKIIDAEIQNIKPDLILTQLTFSPQAVKSSKKFNVPSVMFVRSYEHFCPTGFRDNNDDCKKNCLRCLPMKQKITKYIFVIKWLKDHANAITDADLVIANSNYMSHIIKRWYGRDSELLYPFVNTTTHNTKRKECLYNLFVKPVDYKGVDIVLNVAKMLPNEKFLFVGKTSRQDVISKYKNVRYVEWCDDMEHVYSKAKLLLVPSIWPEPFGRVCVEAQSHGIPVLASNRGGLPEAVGKGGVLINEIFNEDNWIKTINSFNNDEFYEQMSTKAKNNAKKFDFNVIYENFKTLVDKRLGMNL